MLSVTSTLDRRVFGEGSCVTVLAMVDEGDEKGHIALVMGHETLHRIAAWWLESNSVVLYTL